MTCFKFYTAMETGLLYIFSIDYIDLIMFMCICSILPDEKDYNF